MSRQLLPAQATVQAGCVAELRVNRRQRQPWEQAALTDLRDGSVAQAVEAYLTHGRVIVTDGPETMIAAAASDLNSSCGRPIHWKIWIGRAV